MVQHSGAVETGFGQAQFFPATRRIQVAFADAGVGFTASLQRNLELAGRIGSDAEALQLALARRVSGTEGRRNMGMGLEILRTFSDRLDGDLWIASGEALLHRRTAAGNERVNVISSIRPLRGCWICLDAPVS